jgi:VIT1/CCC1 family predicted Fe2+/Mn2+ transporter
MVSRYLTRKFDVSRANWLRAGVLGANDGIISVAGLLIGVAAASASVKGLILAGLAAWAAGTVSMALGEYVSVAAQRDSERAADLPTGDQVNPWHAAASSAASFTGGSILPMLAVAFSSITFRVPILVAAVIVALIATGSVSSRLGDVPPLRPTARIVAGGIAALAVTYGIGRLAGVAGL